MSSEASGVLTIEELARRVRAVEPDAALVTPRELRRVLRGVDRGDATGLRTSRRRSVTVGESEASALLDLEALGLGRTGRADRVVLLIERPEDPALRDRPVGLVLREVWRRLAEAKAQQVLGEPGRLSPERVRGLAGRIDPVAYDEALAVLKRDRLVPDSGGEVAEFVGFAASYLGLRHLAPELLGAYFPALESPERVDAALGEVLDVEALLAGTRPEGASEPPKEGEGGSDGDEEAATAPLPPERSATGIERSAGRIAALLGRADECEAKGNLVRAATLRTRASRLATPSQAGQARARAARALDQLATRLAEALGEPGEESGWRTALRPLLEGASRGVWPVEARLLFDLQKVVLDHGRETYKIDVLEWVLSLGRRSLRRLLPNHREVAECRHLRRALRRLGRARLDDVDRRRLSGVLHRAVADAEERLRERFRPLIARALGRADLTPRNLPERVAFAKVVEELIDLLVSRGYLSYGDIRDAISRNDLKLPDLSARALLRGDRLLRADHRMGISLEGVYRRAEIYLRGLQKGSSVAFGTPLGRLLTLFLILPFGGAFVVLEGSQHLVDPIVHFLSAPHPHLGPKETGPVLAVGSLGLTAAEPFAGSMEHAMEELRGEHVHFVHFWSVGLLGLLVLGLVNHAGFRRLVLAWLRGVWRAIRLVLYVWPMRFAQLPLVRALLGSPTVRAVWRWVVQPMLVTALVLLPLSWGHPDRSTTWMVGVAGFVLSSLLLNSRPGERVKEEIVDSLEHGWTRLAHELVPGLYHGIMEFFGQVVEWVDRLLYTVDEWLRFRSGERRSTLVVKSVFGVVWSMLAYLVRFCVNLLVEPQVNPIKHFPVVTVAHKVMLPFMLALPPVLVAAFGMTDVTANGVAAAAQLLLPGVFGFLVWELKENWRLYEANRPKALGAVPVGHHGESMIRLLRPGFHSGTIPNAYAKLRKAARESRGGGSSKALHKGREAIHHVEESIRHFIERELLTLCRSSQTLGTVEVGPARVHAATFRVNVEVGLACGSASPWVLSFEERLGWLVAGTSEPGWTADLSADSRRALELALSGMLKKAGVALVREQVREALAPTSSEFAVRPWGVDAWCADRPGAIVSYPLGQAAAPPCETSGPPFLDRERIAFQSQAIAWRWWVEAWQRDEAGQPVPTPPTGTVLPAAGAVVDSPLL